MLKKIIRTLALLAVLLHLYALAVMGQSFMPMP
jgi:hypothetical protein